jgi:hypothetical protein
MIRGCENGRLFLVVHPSGGVLANRASGAGGLSVCVAFAAAIPSARDRGGRGICAFAGDFVPPRTSTPGPTRDLKVEEKSRLVTPE